MGDHCPTRLRFAAALIGDREELVARVGPARSQELRSQGCQLRIQGLSSQMQAAHCKREGQHGQL